MHHPARSPLHEPGPAGEPQDTPDRGGDTAPEVSVCVPAYNNALTLREAMDSILAQTGCDYEVVVVDDQSTDSTWQIVQEYARHPRVRIWQNPDRLGMVENWMRTVQRARGRYVKFLFGDDFFVSDHSLSRMVGAIRRAPDTVLVLCARYVADVRSQLKAPLCELPEGSYTFREMVKRSITSRRNTLGEPTCMLLAREALSEDCFSAGCRQLADVDLALSLLRRGRMYYIAEPLVAFRQHAGQQTAVHRSTGLQRLEWQKLAETYRRDLGFWCYNVARARNVRHLQAAGQDWLVCTHSRSDRWLCRAFRWLRWLPVARPLRSGTLRSPAMTTDRTGTFRFCAVRPELEGAVALAAQTVYAGYDGRQSQWVLADPALASAVSLGGRAGVVRATLDGQAYAIKLFYDQRPWTRLRGRLGWAKARRAFSNGLRLARLGVQAPKVLGYAEEIPGRLPLLVMEFMADASRLDKWIAHHEMSRPLIDGVARFIRSMHDRGITHRDLSPRNLMVAPSAKGFDVWLLDYEDVRFRRSVSEDNRLADLHHFDERLLCSVSLRHRLRFLQAYTADRRSPWREALATMVQTSRSKYAQAYRSQLRDRPRAACGAAAERVS